MTPSAFHPAVRAWFENAFDAANKPKVRIMCLPEPDSNDLKKAKNKLDVEGITYRTIRKDDGYGIDWDMVHTSKVHEIIHEVTGIPMEYLGQAHEEGEKTEQRNSYEPKYSIIEIQEHEVEQVKSDFDRLGIDYSVFKTKTGFMVRWNNDDTEKVLKVLDTAEYYYDPKK